MSSKIDEINKLFNSILKNASAGIYVVDKNRRIIAWNEGAEKITGYSAKEVLKKDCAKVLKAVTKDGNNICSENCPMLKAFKNKKPLQCPTANFIHKKSFKVPTCSSITPIVDDNGNLVGGMRLFMDITEQKKIEDKLRKRAFLDGLTLLKNYRSFIDALRTECTRSSRYNHPLSLLFLDIDDFKNFNDQYGHQEGDVVLIKLATMLKDSLRLSDYSFRYGGEEFVVLLVDTNAQQAKRVAEKIRKKFETIPFLPGQKRKPIYKTISIGIAEYCANLAPKKFIQRSDKAMYEAKKQGKNKVCIYTEK